MDKICLNCKYFKDDEVQTVQRMMPKGRYKGYFFPVWIAEDGFNIETITYIEHSKCTRYPKYIEIQATHYCGEYKEDKNA